MPDSQAVDTAKARAVHNRLAITCNNVEVINCYMACFPFNGQKVGTEDLNKFRNAVRRELEFGTVLAYDPKLAWIGNLDGHGKSV
jgi:hypothetical protein